MSRQQMQNLSPFSSLSHEKLATSSWQITTTFRLTISVLTTRVAKSQDRPEETGWMEKLLSDFEKADKNIMKTDGRKLVAFPALNDNWGSDVVKTGTTQALHNITRVTGPSPWRI
jgi:hypothetical protein